jgi:hypothetical protein
MDAQIVKWERKSFSGEDVYRLCEKKVVVRRYRELAKFPTLSKAMGAYGAMIVLYETREGYGHWCAVFEVDRNTVEFFDPYGLAPDQELNFISPEFAEQSAQYPYLSQLLQKSKYRNILYNQKKLQELKSDTNTCGRWCGLRICLRKIPLHKFITLFEKQKFKPDWYVTALTLFV